MNHHQRLKFNKTTSLNAVRALRLDNNNGLDYNQLIHLQDVETSLNRQVKQLDKISRRYKLNKDKILELLNAGAELYLTQYADDQEIRDTSIDGHLITEVEYISQYDGNSFTHSMADGSEIDIVDGDAVYKVHR